MSRRWRPAVLLATMLAVGLFFLSDIALAARPRPLVAISSGVVRLSDLFLGLEAGQDCEIGAAPAPGKRIVIEQPQLAAIAEQFGVEWQPGVVTTRVVLERRARLVTREELMPLLRSALVASGASETSDISLDGFASLPIPAEIAAAPTLETVDLNRTSGRFVAELLFESSGIDPIRLHLSGTAQDMIAVPVLARSISAGSLIGPEDLEIKKLGKSLVGERTLLSTRDIVGLVLRHRLVSGSPIAEDQVSRPLLVTRGMPVLLRLQNTGLTLTAKGEAIEGGALAERIHVLNPDSRAVLVARVTGAGQVQVDPASSPVLLPSEQSGLPSAYNLAAAMRSSSEQGSGR